MIGVRKSTIVPMLQRGHAFLDALRPILTVQRFRNAGV
ncbi:Uncharacterized protein AC517_0780 [Pseudomonas syringae pv. syringae]|nr:Uncharacterized protein AC517_0780 [Pseudomonas syringae pv. syringae]